MPTLSRRQVLCAALGTVGALTLPARSARAATPPTEADLAQYRLALGTELLGIAFYMRAKASPLFAASRRRDFARALANEQQHLAAVSGLLSRAGQAVPTADDFDIALPARAFTSRLRLARLGIELETAFLGAYLGAAATLSDPPTAAVASRLAASQARHLALHWEIADQRPVGPAFPVPLDVEQVSAVLDRYLT
jgi:ferritin-like protein